MIAVHAFVNLGTNSADSMRFIAGYIFDSKPAFASSDKSATLLQHQMGDPMKDVSIRVLARPE